MGRLRQRRRLPSRISRGWRMKFCERAIWCAIVFLFLAPPVFAQHEGHNPPPAKTAPPKPAPSPQAAEVNRMDTLMLMLLSLGQAPDRLGAGFHPDLRDPKLIDSTMRLMGPGLEQDEHGVRIRLPAAQPAPEGAAPGKGEPRVNPWRSRNTPGSGFRDSCAGTCCCPPRPSR